MKAFHTSNWQQKVVVTTMAMMIGAGVLEFVAGSMEFPNPGTMAVREQFLAAESARALELRTLQQEQMHIATVPAAHGI